MGRNPGDTINDDSEAGVCRALLGWTAGGGCPHAGCRGWLSLQKNLLFEQGDLAGVGWDAFAAAGCSYYG